MSSISTPWVSIVLPCHNSADFIDETLDSVARQTFKQFEISAIDDASDDATGVKLMQWRKRFPDMQIYTLKKNVGPGQARNIGIVRAQHDLIALIDSDDRWHPEKLEQQVAVHVKKNCAVSCTAFTFRGKQILPVNTDYISLLKNNVVNTSSVMFDRSKIDISFKSESKNEDYIAWLDVAKTTPIHPIARVLVQRCNTEGVSRNKFRMASQRWRVYREIEGLSLLKSSYYFVHYAVSGVIKHWQI